MISQAFDILADYLKKNLGIDRLILILRVRKLTAKNNLRIYRKIHRTELLVRWRHDLNVPSLKTSSELNKRVKLLSEANVVTPASKIFARRNRFLVNVNRHFPVMETSYIVVGIGETNFFLRSVKAEI